MNRQINNTQLRSKSKVNYFDTPMNELDLDLDNYTLDDLFNLFNITDKILNEDIMKQAKIITSKIHPDKSHLDPKFFIFFREAYIRLKDVYEYQNKSNNKRPINYENDVNEVNENNAVLLKNFIKQSKFDKNSNGFNSWFNENFEKYKLEDPNDRGYSEWLKSNDDFIEMPDNITMSNMNKIIEGKKKNIKAVTIYKGVEDTVSTIRGLNFGSLNEIDNFTSEKYTDLKQAYTETLMPVSEEDFDKMPKFKNVDQYRSHRDNVDVTPLNELESLKILERQQRAAQKQSQELAYKYALEAEKVKQNDNSFWSALKQLTG
jgi:hypothetical protein